MSSAAPAFPPLATQVSHAGASFPDRAAGTDVSNQDMFTALPSSQPTAISITVSKPGGDQALQAEFDPDDAFESDNDPDASDSARSGHLVKRVTGDAAAREAGRTFCSVVLEIQKTANATLGCTALSNATEAIKNTTQSARHHDVPEKYMFLDQQKVVVNDLKNTDKYNCTIWPGPLKDRFIADSESYLVQTKSRKERARSRRLVSRQSTLTVANVQSCAQGSGPLLREGFICA